MAIWLRVTGEADVVWPHLSMTFSLAQLRALLGGPARAATTERRLGDLVLLVSDEAPRGRRNLQASVLAGVQVCGDCVLLTAEELAAAEEEPGRERQRGQPGDAEGAPAACPAGPGAVPLHGQPARLRPAG